MKRLKSGIITLILILSTVTIIPGAQAKQVKQGVTYKVIQKQIQIDGLEVSNPETVIYKGVTYIPLLNIMDLLKRFGFRTDWSGQALYISSRPDYPDTVASLPFGVIGGIYLNGSLVNHAPFFKHYDPVSGLDSPYFSLSQVMQVINRIGLHSTWDGEVLQVIGDIADFPVYYNNFSDISTPVSTLSANGQPATAKTENDELFWKRSDANFYVGVTTDNIFSGTPGNPLLFLQPDKPFFLYTYFDHLNTGKTQWFVNSPDASVITNPVMNGFRVGNFKASVALFIAKKPGIYTIQAESRGKYSIPFALIVGFNQLPHIPMNRPTADSGIQPLPGNLASLEPETVTDYTYFPYPQNNGWLPVQGTTTLGVKSMIVDLKEVGGNLWWDYQLPVSSDGKFSAMVRIPFTGTVGVYLIPDEFEGMDLLHLTAADNSAGAQYFVDNSVATTEQQRALFANSFINFNMNAALVSAAETLYESSPSPQTAIEAISNFASEKTVFDWPEFIDNTLFLQNASATWNLQTGTDIDVTNLTAAMLRSVGIPTEILFGNFPSIMPNKLHSWLRVWVGAQSYVFDPTIGTWTNVGNISDLRNEFFNSSALFHDDISDGNAYTFYEGIY